MQMPQQPGAVGGARQALGCLRPAGLLLQLGRQLGREGRAVAVTELEGVHVVGLERALGLGEYGLSRGGRVGGDLALGWVATVTSMPSAGRPPPAGPEPPAQAEVSAQSRAAVNRAATARGLSMGGAEPAEALAGR
ncbi:hypothetical protein [Streptomyces sp. NPDC058304]|uniref:hypothetical protein n=1 Tax=Streptomyces sp. NPDC058304 TaxID=3346437 RepID=UPI0036EE95B9